MVQSCTNGPEVKNARHVGGLAEIYIMQNVQDYVDIYLQDLGRWRCECQTSKVVETQLKYLLNTIKST